MNLFDDFGEPTWQDYVAVILLALYLMWVRP